MPLPRSGARATTSVARGLLVAVLALAGVTCTDSSPTGPVAPNEASLTGSDVVITPATDTVLVGGSATLSAKLANGSALSKTAVWTSSDTSVAVVVSTGVSTARVTGRKPGRATIMATSGTKSGTNSTVVLPVPVRSVTVTPDSASIERGDSVQFTAMPRDSAGNPLTGRTVTWSVADYNVASVSATGRATGLARGATIVTATSEGVSGSAPVTVRVAQLVVASIAAQDTLNAGDTLRVVYAVQNLQDRFDADSVIVRVGFRNGDGFLVAVRRALPRIAAGATVTDTARLVVPAGTAGLRQVAAYADCRDLTGATDVTRLTSCEGDPANAGAIGEGSEIDNERTRNVVVRGAELGATLAGPDTVRTRTTASLAVTVSNSGSATGVGFDVVAGVYDLTTGTVIAATAATTPALGSRQTRALALDVAIPATASTSHRYELRAYADCPASGIAATQALQLCMANSSGGAIIESTEADNVAAAPTAVVSNVARVVVLPDTIRLTAIGDTASLAAAAYDGAGAPVQGVAFSWSAIGSAATVTNGGVRAAATGSARVVATGEGRADTATVIVTQVVARVVAAPDTARLGAIGDTSQFSAAAFDANGSAVAGAAFAWTSLDPAVASVSASGTARAVANGAARLVASSGSAADTVTVVVAQEVATVTVTPDHVSRAAFGDTVAFVAAARDRSGATMGSATITWSSLDPTIASVSATGVATARADGQARIVASSGAAADTAVITVQQAVVRVAATPDTARLAAIGDSARVTATAFDANGNAMPAATVAWSTLDPTVAGVSATGTVTAIANGTSRIVASSNGASDTVVVVVRQEVATVVASPDSAMLTAIGATAAFDVTARDRLGVVVTGATVAWSSLDPGIASVSVAGVATALANGRARLVASSGAVADTAIVFVAQAVARVTATPDSARLTAIGDTARFDATALDANGSAVATTITWSSLDTAIASVSVSGTATGYANGAARLVASSAGAADTVVVIVAQEVASLYVPDSLMLSSLGDSGRLYASAFDRRGAPVAGAEVTWSALDPGIATVSAEGDVRAVANGRARAVAASGAVADTTIVVVRQQVVSVAAAPDSVVLSSLGDTARFGAGAADRRGNPVADAAIVWTSLEPAVASVVAPGIVVSAATGRARIVASSGDAADTVVVVAQQALAALTVAPDSVVLVAVGDSARLTARAADGRNNVVNDAPISWTALDPAIATVSATGTAVAVADGTARVVAASGALADTVSVVVARQVAAVVAPDSLTLSALGDSALLSAVARDRSGAPIETTLQWTALDPSIASVSDAGEVRALANGRARAIVTAGQVADTVAVLVRQVVASLVAQPDSVVLVSLGDTARFGAGAADRRGNPVTDASIVWTSLDPGVAAVRAPGVATSVATGRARIVASSGDAADTVVVVSQQAVASVEIAADTTLTRENENVVLTAVLRDAAGNLMPGAPDMWWSIDPAVTIDSTGRVTPMSPGDARVVARSGTRTDTAVVLVNPAGYGFRWLGAQFGGWSNPDNWYPHQVPQRDTDDVYVPARTANRPTLSGYALVGAVRVDELATIDLAGFNMIANGDVDARGSIDGGTVEMRGAGAVSGNLYQLEVKAAVTLAGRTFARYAMVRDGGTLTLAGHTLASSNVGTDGSGTVVEDNAADSIVTEMANFGGQGATRLTAGVLKVSGSFYQYGPAGSLTVGGTHRTVFDGAYAHSASFADTSAAGFHDVDVLDAHGLNFQSGGNVGGLLRLAPGAGVSSQGNLKFLTRLPDVAQGSYDVQSTVIAGDVVADRDFTTAGSLFAMDNARLTLNGHRIEARWMATQNAVLVMNQPADTLLLHDGATLYGTEQLSAGTMIVRGGSLFVNAQYGGSGAFVASGTHTLVFDGNPYATINLDQPERHHIANLRVINGGALAFQTDAHVYGRLTVDASSAVTQGNGGKIYYHGPLPDVARGRYEVWSNILADTLALDEDVALPEGTSLMIDDLALLSLNGHRLEVGTLYSQMNGRLVMPGASPAETLVVRRDANLYGATELRGGVLDLHGSLWMRGVPVPTTAPIGTRAIFSGPVQHTFDTNDWQTDSLVIGDVEVRDGGTLSFSRALVLNGLLTLGQGSTLNGGNSELRINRALPDLERGTVQIGGMVVRGDVTMDADRRYDNGFYMVRIAPPAWLRLNGHTLRVTSFANEAGSPPGGIVMDNDRDSLVVTGTLYMFGMPHLSAGTMVIKGDFQHDGNWGIQTFAPTGTHTTVLAGSAAQHIRLDGADGSHFNNLSIDNAAGVDLESSLTLTGQLRGAGNGVLRSTNGYAIHAAGLDVAGLVLDGVAVESSGGTLARFDNVTFQNLSPYQPGQLTIRHPGPASPFTIHNLTFLSEPADGYGWWLVAEDTDAATAPLAIEVVSAQAASGPARTQTLGGATVTWRSEVAANP